jgi:Glycosyl hydrolase family 26
MLNFAKSYILLLTILLLPSLSFASNSGTLYAGMYPDDFWRNTEILNSVAAWTGKPMTFGGTFLDASEDPSNIIEKLEQAWMAQSTPFANIEVTGNTASVASGALDAELTNLASSVKAWLDKGEGRSVIIAPMQEMNLQESRWGCDAANYPTAFRKFVAAFAQVGIDDDTKVRWAFAPNGWTTPACGSIAPYYPGDAVVDIIGISAYNFGPNEWDGKYRAPSEIYTYLNELRSFAPNKPYLIAQTGTAPQGGDRDAWLREMFAVLTSDPNTVGFLYFNKDKSSWGGNEWDWRIFDERALGGATGFIEGMQSPSTLYQWPLNSWFQPGSLPLNP